MDKQYYFIEGLTFLKLANDAQASTEFFDLIQSFEGTGYRVSQAEEKFLNGAIGMEINAL